MGKYAKLLRSLAYLLIWGTLFYELLLNPSIREGLTVFLQQHPLLAPLILTVVQLALASFALPCSALTVLAGALWGVWYGVLFSTLATIVASMWTFLLGRAILTRFVSKRVDHTWYLKVQELINRYHWKAAMVAHANPIFPGSSLGYIFGLSEVNFKSFVIGAILGTLPLQIVLVGIGHLTVKALVGNLSLWVVCLLSLLVFVVAFYKKAISFFLR